MQKADQIVQDNIEQFNQLNNYLIKATKFIYTVKGRRYTVSVNLQFFTDDAGNIKLVREV